MAQGLRTRPRGRSPALRVVVAVIVVLLALGAVVALRGGDGSEDQLHSYAPSERAPMSDLRGRALDGSALDLHRFAGRVVVVNVWGSWCGPCRGEAYALARVARSTAAQGVQFVGVDVRDPSREAADAFVEKFGIPYPSLEATADTGPLLALQGILPVDPPGTLVIDAQGRIAARAVGAVTEQQLRDLLDPVLAERG